MDATQTLQDAEQAHQKALADAAAARQAFENTPSAKTHSALAVSEQVARNTASQVESARIEAEKARRAELTKRLIDARARANRDTLIRDIEELCAQLVELVRTALPLVQKIEGRIRTQHEGSADAKGLAVTLGEHADSDEPISFDLVRDMVGVRIAQWLADTDYHCAFGRGFYTWLQPRWDMGHPSPSQPTIREARALVISRDAYMPSPKVDWTKDHAPVAPWEETPADRPQRWEV